MFNQLPEEETHKNIKLPSKKRNKRKKKPSQNKPFIVKKDKKRHCKITSAMSNWAESFAFAATWHLKHQVAYWKARAKSLEYENKILHDIISKKHLIEVDSSVGGHRDTAEEVESSDLESDALERDTNIHQTGTENFEDDPEGPRDSDNIEDDFEVSEEFIQFLTANAKYKEDARRERERLKALREAEEKVEEKMEEGPSETAEQRQNTWKELYGDAWQRISALEMAMHSRFICESDKSKPVYWPHIPFNLSYN